MPKIEHILNTTVVKQEFIAEINGIKFYEKELYKTVYNILCILSQKFEYMENLDYFIKLLKNAIYQTYIQNKTSLEYITSECNYNFDNVNVLSYKSIELSISKIIDEAKNLDELVFDINTNFDTLNKEIKNKKFNY